MDNTFHVQLVITVLYY